MAITFPSNPSLNDTFTSGGKTFQWNGTSWTVNQEANILTDTTPQLGGDLDLNSQDITGTGDINVTGTITATSFSGTLNSSDLTGALPALDGSALIGAGTTTTAEWTLGADGSNHYTFTGPGVADGATDPTIYLTRGQTYKFKNRSGGHPFRIQYEFQNTGGTAYNDGITNNAAGNGTDLYWEVRNDTPDVLYYQCTAHTNMSGRINMISGESKVVGLTSTTATARDAGITTATGSIIYIPDVGMQVYSGNTDGWKTVADTSETGPSPYGTYTTSSLYSYWDISNTSSYTGSNTTLTDLQGNQNLTNTGDNPNVGGSGYTKYITQASQDYPYYSANNRNYGLGNVSIEIWAFTTGRTGDDYLFNFYSGSGGAQSRALRLMGANNAYGFVGNGSESAGNDKNNIGTLSNNTWYQFVFTLSNYTGLVVYENGSSVYSNTMTLSDGGGGWGVIGNTNWNGGDNVNVWKGGWALCRFYTKTLSSTEVSANWNGTKARFGL